MGEVVVSSEREMEVEKDGKREAETNGSAEVVGWEKVLPRMVLRVLLVEADDSTRQIIAALLRKCSYRVAAVPDGLMAWETLKGRPHNIDLILTEVELPSISGFALLTLVMEHDICKNIPVIMMSSHDSISMVLKCMLKGAADFLIKPVRRNELRNLWQHVWRRHSLLGGQVHQNLPIVQCKDEAISENNAASNHSSDYAASKQKNKDNEKESEAQGLSQLKCRSASNFYDANMEKHVESVKLEMASKMPQSKTAGVPDELIVSEKLNRSGSEVAPCNDAFGLEEVHACAETMTQDEGMEPENDRRSTNVISGIHSCSDERIEPSTGAIDLIGTFDNHLKSPDRLTNVNNGMNKSNKFDVAPQLELTLRKFFPSTLKDQGKNERHALNHSTASAFTWYNNSKKFPNSSSNFTELKDSTSESHQPLFNKVSENATGSSLPCDATLSNNPETMASLAIGQSGQTGPRPHLGFIPVPKVRFDNICAGYSHVFPPIFYTQSGLPSAWRPKSSCRQESSSVPLCTSVQSDPDIHDSQQGYQQSDEITNKSIEQTVLKKNELEPLEDLRHGAPAADQSVKGSLCNGYPNNNSSDMYGGVCSRIDGNASAKETEKGIALENLNKATLFIHDGFRGPGSHRSNQREAALTKFRLKRKDRCYEKKVRYQSRKSLAEQRPRVKGQFVRQVKTDAKVANVDGCP